MSVTLWRSPMKRVGRPRVEPHGVLIAGDAKKVVYMGWKCIIWEIKMGLLETWAIIIYD